MQKKKKTLYKTPNQKGKVLLILERDGKLFLGFKLLANVKICEILDCYKFQEENQEVYFQELN